MFKVNSDALAVQLYNFPLHFSVYFREGSLNLTEVPELNYQGSVRA